LEIQAYSGYCAVGTRGSTPLLFNIARSEKMRLDSSGNLLVGTTTATGKASIAGAITATASSALVNPSVGVFGLYTSGAIPNTYLQMPSGGSIDFWKPDTSVAARIDSSGNFLIGTTNAPSNIGLGTKFNTSNGIQYGNSQRSVIANPGTKTFTITGGSNGGATYFSIEANQYNGYVSAYFYCINASGNWTVNQVTRTTSGTAPTITITNNNSATVTVAVNVNSSYSGGFITIDMSLNYISVA